MSNVAEKERFQIWLMEMDNAIDAFIASVPPDKRDALDGSDASLDALEAIVLARYANYADTQRPEEAKFLDGAARYLGDVIQRRTGSKWSVRLDDPKALFHGLPILSGGKIRAMGECPLSIVTASTDRRTGTYFSKLLSHLTK